MKSYNNPPDIQPFYSHEYKMRMAVIQQKREDSRMADRNDVIKGRGSGYTFSVELADKKKLFRKKSNLLLGQTLPDSGVSVEAESRVGRSKGAGVSSNSSRTRSLSTSSLGNTKCNRKISDDDLSWTGRSSRSRSSSRGRSRRISTGHDRREFRPVLGRGGVGASEGISHNNSLSGQGSFSVYDSIAYGYQRSPSRARITSTCPSSPPGSWNEEVSYDLPEEALWPDRNLISSPMSYLSDDILNSSEARGISTRSPSPPSGARPLSRRTAIQSPPRCSAPLVVTEPLQPSSLLALPAYWLPSRTARPADRGALHGVVVVRSLCSLAHLSHVLRQQFAEHLPTDFDVKILGAGGGDGRRACAGGRVTQSFRNACSCQRGPLELLSLNERSSVCAMPCRRRLHSAASTATAASPRSSRDEMQPLYRDNQIQQLEYDLLQLSAVPEEHVGPRVVKGESRGRGVVIPAVREQIQQSTDWHITQIEGVRATDTHRPPCGALLGDGCDMMTRSLPVLGRRKRTSRVVGAAAGQDLSTARSRTLQSPTTDKGTLSPVRATSICLPDPQRKNSVPLTVSSLHMECEVRASSCSISPPVADTTTSTLQSSPGHEPLDDSEIITHDFLDLTLFST